MSKIPSNPRNSKNNNKVISKLTSDNEADLSRLKQLINKAKASFEEEQIELVLIFFTQHYQRVIDQALIQCCKQISSLNVFGAIVDGVCTEEDWIFDRPAIALMLFSPDTISQVSIQNETILNEKDKIDNQQLATQSIAKTPNIANTFSLQYSPTINYQEKNICGLVSNLSFANGRLIKSKHIPSSFSAIKVNNYFIHPWQTIGEPLIVNKGKVATQLLFNQLPLKDSLKKQLQNSNVSPPAYHLLALLKLINSTEKLNQDKIQSKIKAGEYQEILLLDENNLDNFLVEGDQVIFVLRSNEQAILCINQTIKLIKQKNSSYLDQSFILLHSSSSMGPEFYGYRDEFHHALKKNFGGVPLVGGYASAINFSGINLLNSSKENNTATENQINSRQYHHAAVATLITY